MPIPHKQLSLLMMIKWVGRHLAILHLLGRLDVLLECVFMSADRRGSGVCVGILVGVLVFFFTLIATDSEVQNGVVLFLFILHE